MTDGLADKKFLNALLLAPNVGYDAVLKLKIYFNSYEEAWCAGEGALIAAGLSPQTATSVKKSREQTSPESEMACLLREGVSLIEQNEPDFPELLKEIPSPPLWLYIKGKVLAKEDIVAIVGSRKATSYGVSAVERIVAGLAPIAEVAIASGIAMGIDEAAHRASLKNGLRTIAVIGSGLDRESFFPPKNIRLAEEIVNSGGAVISEYPLGMPPLRQNFVQRNRIIAGLSKGVLVVEAAEKSGALITAHFALEQGRSVMAVPGPIFSPYSAGTNSLIRQGASVAATSDDLIEEMGLATKSPPDLTDNGLTGREESNMLGHLDRARAVDELVRLTGMNTADVISQLSMLELQGRIKNMGGGTWVRVK